MAKKKKQADMADDSGTTIGRYNPVAALAAMTEVVGVASVEAMKKMLGENNMTEEMTKPAAVLATTMSFDELAAGSAYIDQPEVVDKETLIGKEFVILDVKINETGDFGPFCSLTCLLRDKSQVVINDGSTGVYKQVTEGGITAPHYCRKGLRVSEYEWENGKRAKTYYLTGGAFKAA